MATSPKYPNVEANLVGEDGNAFAIIGTVTAALQAGGVDKTQRAAFMKEAMSGDYDSLLVTCMKWVKVK